MASIKGGQKLASELRRLAKMVARPATLRVGFLEGATYPDGTPVGAVATFQEFGTPNAKHPIPPRPFFRNMIRDKSGEWGPAMADLLKSNDYDARRVLELTGQAIAGQLRASIIATNAPPLSPVTIRRKGFSKPLIDTGHMLNSIDYEVT